MKFKSDASPFCFLMICFTINIVHVTLTIDINIKKEDVKECLRQIKFAFKSLKTTQCFSYAVEHYKKGEYIPVYASEIPSTSDQSQNIASSSGQSQNITNFNSQDFPEQTSAEQFDISSEDLSYIGKFDGLKDFIKNDPQNNPQVFYDESSECEEQHQYPLNYAMAFYALLEALVQGTNIIPALPYCEQFYKGDEDCKKALEDFGDDRRSAKYAAEVALTKYKLIKVTDPYIKSYVMYIRDNIKIRRECRMEDNIILRGRST